MSGPVLCSYSKMLLQEHFDVYDVDGLRIGDEVVLETRRGLEFGRVVAEPGATRLRRNEATAGKVLRRAAMEDKNAHRAEQVRVIKRPEIREARRFAEERGLEMTFIDLEETLDQKKLVFYFMAPNRVDFRDLVRDMATTFAKKIELRQIGDRDVARLSGDVGSCGHELCCKTFLLDFVPVTMKMAKNQGLGLDNNKISGMCGRLKCCLKYED
ncbi:MAG: hypothetical protein KDB07_12445, partial [Planctomycetes bacterium]|nr:hypothetical protein [Planctomycetota bacterium]